MYSEWKEREKADMSQSVIADVLGAKVGLTYILLLLFPLLPILSVQLTVQQVVY